MDKVKRWDIYDIADSLDDVPWLIMRAADDPRELAELAREVQLFAARLYQLAKIGGCVGPYPEYQQVTPTEKVEV